MENKKTALITGASRGLGLELARLFARNGYQLYLHANSKRLPNIKNAKMVYGDLERKTTTSAIINKVGKDKLDIFINNAAIYQSSPFAELSHIDLVKILNVNLVAPALLINRLWPIGLLVNINSLAGKQGSFGEAGYCASKHGLRGLSQSISIDATAAGGRIMDVYLGAMQTDMTKGRDSREKFIDPKEAAQTIFKVCDEKKTLQIRELTIARTKY
jgi:3-oxoacyl-[acyl-carrier protein] reductase